MLKISDSSASIIKAVGVILLVGLFALLSVWKDYFNSLANYQRLALASGLLLCKPMLFIDFYRQSWAGLDEGVKLYAVMFPLIPLATALGALIWYMSDPSARA
jgi:hypothetical protein